MAISLKCKASTSIPQYCDGAGKVFTYHVLTLIYDIIKYLLYNCHYVICARYCICDFLNLYNYLKIYIKKKYKLIKQKSIIKNLLFSEDTYTKSPFRVST